MQFIKRGERFTVIRITGPAHNLLGIEFGNGTPNSEIVVEKLEKQSKEADSLTSEDVQKNVLLGVSEANDQFGTAYVVKCIEFVSSDSPPVEIYRLLAKSIIERIVRGGSFMCS
jgi:hypothetical protein